MRAARRPRRHELDQHRDLLPAAQHGRRRAAAAVSTRPGWCSTASTSTRSRPCSMPVTGTPPRRSWQRPRAGWPRPGPRASCWRPTPCTRWPTRSRRRRDSRCCTSPTPPPRRSGAQGLTRVGLLATAFTMEDPFYVERLARHGIEAVVPDAAGRADVHRIIYDELVRDVVRPESRAALPGRDGRPGGRRRRGDDPRLHRGGAAGRARTTPPCRRSTPAGCTRPPPSTGCSSRQVDSPPIHSTSSAGTEASPGQSGKSKTAIITCIGYVGGRAQVRTCSPSTENSASCSSHRTAYSCH